MENSVTGSLGTREAPPPSSVLFAGQSLIEATVGQVLKDFERKYDDKVKENKRLQDKVKWLEGGRASTENENLLYQRIQKLEGKVKELKGQLTRRSEVRMETGGEADSDVTIFDVGLEETQQILPTDMEAVWSATESGGSSQISGESVIRQPRPESDEESNPDEARPQDTTIDHCELPRSSSGDFRCSCGRMYKLKYCLVQHINYSKGDFKFSCDSCGKRFFSPFHLKRHLRVHGQVLESSAKAGCYGCGKMFPSVKIMHAHRRSTSCGNPQSASTEAI